MMQAIGAPMMQAAIPVMKSVTELFTNIGAFANKNPGAISDIAKGLGVLGVALVGGGAAAILAALGPAGWIAGGVIALAGAVAIFGPNLWTGLITGLNAVADALGNFLKKILWVASKLFGVSSAAGADVGGIGGGGSQAPSGFHSFADQSGVGGGGVGHGVIGANGLFHDAGGMQPGFKSEITVCWAPPMLRELILV